MQTNTVFGADTDSSDSTGWPAFKFEPNDANCKTCGSNTSPSPFSLGSFSLYLMAPPPGSKKSLAARNVDLRLRGTKAHIVYIVQC